MILRAPRLARLAGVHHGFSTRLGGASAPGPFASFNLGLAVGDARPRVHENRARFLALVGLPALAEVDQVHGDAIRRVAVGGVHGEADALYTDTPGLLVGVRTADCAPILLVSRPRGARPLVAAIHAGWRGAAAGIVRTALRHLAAEGHPAATMSVAIGPMIERAAFEVGDEVIASFEARLGVGRVPVHVGPRGRPHLDLRAVVTQDLLEAGVPADEIEHVGGCTAENVAMFFSHRRDGAPSGRQLSAIGLTGPDEGRP